MIFEKIRKELEKQRTPYDFGFTSISLAKSLSIINQVEAEYKEEYKSKCAECTRRKFYMMGYQAAKENNGWIPCSERLPEDGENVLLCIKGYEIQTGYKTNTRDGECFYMHKSEDYAVLGDVIAWQPLPEPYTPKGE